MLPCQNGCSAYCSGCHKNCGQWREFQARQAIQRQAKKNYLRYYNELCAAVTRQFRMLSPR
ncbi:hypothetical protein [Flavonifractor hominis]|uniref:DUF3795 domain-containing protein n=1 Tax=Flavonifractor hominis TaxID=3133178 RepID=A0ABV1ET07_9FIRM